MMAVSQQAPDTKMPALIAAAALAAAVAISPLNAIAISGGGGNFSELLTKCTNAQDLVYSCLNLAFTSSQYSLK